MLSVLALAAAGCLEDEFNPGGELVGSDNEVQFGLSLNDPSTKTIYGPENDFGFPLYWSEGDKIQIASPQCVEGRNYAEYLVTPESGQSYAIAMTKTGEYGVQWGSEEKAVFYSIYPSNGTSWPTLTSGNVVAQLNIASEQSANLVLNPASETTSGWYQAADMSNVIMYSQASADKGDVVKLNYKPYSTILEFELGIAQNKDEQGNLVPENSTTAIAWGTVKVVSMTLIAPTGISIAGDFTLKFNGSNAPTIAAAGNNSNSIEVIFATQPMLDKENQTLKVKLAMIPISGVTTLDGWQAVVKVLEGTKASTYTKTFSGSGTATALAPGKIHKIKLPRFSSVEKWEVNPGEWIPTLEDYKNIYLTELSLPGAWYSLGKDENAYQAQGSTATSLWNAGIRAFAVECRTVTSGRYDETVAGVSVSGTQSQGGLLGFGDHCFGGTRISSVIKSIAEAINHEEFGVLVLSYADGGDGGHRTEDYAYFLEGIQKEITASEATNIYSGTLTTQTTVYDVLGQLVIKINVDDNITLGSYDKKMNALISYNPFMKQLTAAEYTSPLFSKMYWQTWADTYKTFATANNTDFLWCFSSANRTQPDPTGEANPVAGLPTYAQRQTALATMIQHSQEIYENSSHNVWFYFNAGGTQTSSPTAGTTAAGARTFASTMNKWLLDVIRLKANGGTDTYGIYGTKGAYVESDPSSLGIVMFNQCTGDNNTYHGADIIDEIIKMNNKFKLQRAKQDPDPKSAAPSYASGMDTNDSAFGWD